MQQIFFEWTTKTEVVHNVITWGELLTCLWVYIIHDREYVPGFWGSLHLRYCSNPGWQFVTLLIRTIISQVTFKWAGLVDRRARISIINMYVVTQWCAIWLITLWLRGSGWYSRGRQLPLCKRLWLFIGVDDWLGNVMIAEHCGDGSGLDTGECMWVEAGVHDESVSEDEFAWIVYSGLSTPTWGDHSVDFSLLLMVAV